MRSSKKLRLLLIVSATLLILLVLFALLRNTSDPITQHALLQLVEHGEVQRVIDDGETFHIFTKNRCYAIVHSQVPPETFADITVERDGGSGLWILLIAVAILLLGGISIYIRYKMKHTPNALGTAPVTSPDADNAPVTPVRSDITFADIGGISDVKEELEEIIDFIKHPGRYRKFGARLPKGVLLVGPPGVGKTMIAKAVAAEADAPFYYQSASSFVHIYVGMGAKRVHNLFASAEANAPAIIFIDEIDAVGKTRDSSSNDEREATLNQLLTEMDGFSDSSGVIVIAATNKIDVLDPALLRAGRFDRRIFVELPAPKEREAIVEKYLRHIPNAVSAEAVAEVTVGFNGAALAALINEAALCSLRQRNGQMTMEDILAVKDKVAFGKKRLMILSDKQKRCRALYLAAKALTAAWYDLPFEKAVLGTESIRPTLAEPLMRHEIEAHIRMLLAGRVICDMRLGEHASSAKEDLAQAIALCEAMLFEYGMGTTLQPERSETGALLTRLESETRKLLSGQTEAIDAVMEVLLKDESIATQEIKAKINVFL